MNTARAKPVTLVAVGVMLSFAATIFFLLGVLGIVGPYILFMPDDIDPVDRPPNPGPIIVAFSITLGLSYGAWRSFRSAKRNGTAAT